MSLESFPEATKLREALKPRLTLRRMAFLMNVSHTYLRELECGIRGIHGWPAHRKRDFLKIVNGWARKPNPLIRKKRTLKRDMVLAAG